MGHKEVGRIWKIQERKHKSSLQHVILKLSKAFSSSDSAGNIKGSFETIGRVPTALAVTGNAFKCSYFSCSHLQL